MPKRTALEKLATKIASRATSDNPVSVLQLGSLYNTVLASLKAGDGDDVALRKGIEFIDSVTEAAFNRERRTPGTQAYVETNGDNLGESPD